MATPRSALERYVQAKDTVQPQLMQEIFAPDALLTYSIATDSISFPPRTVGLPAITDILVMEFSKRFAACKTYYVCEAAPLDEMTFARIPWLVVMREPAAVSLRIGKGYYEWRFAPPALVTAMHIHIDRMDAIPDPSGNLLSKCQAELPYPWLKPAMLQATYKRRAQANPALAFLHDFEQPLSLPSH